MTFKWPAIATERSLVIINQQVLEIKSNVEFGHSCFLPKFSSKDRKVYSSDEADKKSDSFLHFALESTRRTGETSALIPSDQLTIAALSLVPISCI